MIQTDFWPVKDPASSSKVVLNSVVAILIDESV